jgi:hypothetical protein
MIKLMFYYGPGDRITNTIRLLTGGPYSHVELQFTDGCRFFSSGHGEYTGCHMICDRKVYDRGWDQVLIPATREQEKAAEKYTFGHIGIPFDFLGMGGYLVPFFDHFRKPLYCSSLVLDVLQKSLHMFAGAGPGISPNGLHRLFLMDHPLVISAAVPDGEP